MYRKLVEFCSKGELSFKYVKTFNMDEYVALPRDHPESYHSFMWENFFKHIDIDPSNAHILDGNAPDLVKECDDFEVKITEAGGIDLFVGGKGRVILLMSFCCDCHMVSLLCQLCQIFFTNQTFFFYFNFVIYVLS